MDGNRLCREPKTKGNLSKRSNGIISGTNLSAKQTKNKSKNKMILNKNQIEEQGENRKNKMSKTSFNQVVDKFKKLFDEKIKFANNDFAAVTQRVENGKGKKYGSNDYSSGNKVKKVDNANKKTNNKQGFSELITNIEATLNNHHRIIKNSQQQHKSIQQSKGGYSITLPFQSYNKNKNLSIKSKQKNNRSTSKQRIRSTNKTFSAGKNTERVRPFENVFQHRQNQDDQFKPKLKSRKSSNKIKKGNKIMLEQKYEIDNLKKQTIQNNEILSEAKYKKRLKTFESEHQKTNNKAQQQKKQKKHTRTHQGQTKLTERQNQMKKIQKNSIKESKKPKKIKQVKQKNKSKQKKKYIISYSQRSREGKLPQKQELKKIEQQKRRIGQLKNRLLNTLEEQQILNQKQYCTVSSSSDRHDDSQQGASSCQYSHQNSQQQRQQEQFGAQCGNIQSKQDGEMIGSVIMYQVSEDDNLKFGSKLLRSDPKISSQYSSEQAEWSQSKQTINQNKNQFNPINTQRTRKQNRYFLTTQMVKYFRGLLGHLQFIKQKQFIQQFQNSNNFKNPHKNKLDHSEPKINQQKISIKIQQVFKQEEQKWLSLKESLEKIKRSGNFNQALDKIIYQAEQNHLSLKVMEIRQSNLLQQNQIKQKQKYLQQKIEFAHNCIDNSISQNNKNQTELNQKHGVNHKQSFEDNQKILGISKISRFQRFMKTDYIDQREDCQDSEKTIKGQIRSQGNQININIKISDHQIKIESPFKNYIQKINNSQVSHNILREQDFQQMKIEREQFKQVQSEKKQMLEEVSSEFKITNVQLNPQRNIYNEKQISKQEYVAQSYSISQSELEMQMLINQFSKPNSQQLKEYKNNIQKQKNKNSIIEKSETMSNKQEHNIPIEQQAKAKKLKLSYQEAPLQIKKILERKKQITGQEQIRSKELNNRMVSQDLNLNQLIFNQRQKSQEDDISKRLKIFQQIKSPSNHNHNIRHIMSRLREDLSNSQSQQKIECHQSQNNSFRKNNKIRISLFSNNDQKHSRFYSSDGQLMNKAQQRQCMVGSKQRQSKKKVLKENKNLIIIKPKSNEGNKQQNKIKFNCQIEPSRTQIIEEVVQNIKDQGCSLQQESLKQQSESLLINKSSSTHQIQNKNKEAIGNQLKQQINGQQQTHRIDQQMQFKIYEEPSVGQTIKVQWENQSREKQVNIYSQLLPWLKTDLDKDGTGRAPRPSPSHKLQQIGEQDLEDQQNDKCFVLRKPRYLLTQVDQCVHQLVDVLVDELCAEFVCKKQKNKQSHINIQYLLGQQLDYQLSKIGNHLLNHFNISSINITGQYQEESSEDKNQSPFYRIQRFRDTQSPQDVSLQNQKINIEKPNINTIKLFSQVQENGNSFKVADYNEQFEACFENDEKQLGQNSGESEVNKPRTDIHYIVNLAQSLFQYIKGDEMLYGEFCAKIKTPLGVDSLSLFRAMRENQQQQDDNSHSGQIQSQVPMDSNSEQDLDKLYIISLETLVAFQFHVVNINSLNYQQIFNQAIYDHINMLLDNFRPFGLRGLPSLNFEHKYKYLNENNKQQIDYARKRSDPRFNRQHSYEDILSFVLESLCQNLKIKLGMNRIQVGGQQSIAYSINKFISQYASQLDWQFVFANDGQFLIKYSIMLQLEELILHQEITTIGNLIQKRQLIFAQR